MQPDIPSIVQQIHDSPYRTVAVAAGAGTSAIKEIVDMAGASRTLLEAVVPYSQPSFDDFLGKPPKRYVAAESARLLAGRAYTRAVQLNVDDVPLIGLACTAATVSDRNRRGQNHGYIATWQPNQLKTYGLVLQKGRRSRIEEERIYSLIMLSALATACGIDTPIEILLEEDETIEETVYDFHAVTHKLANRELDFFALNDHGRIRTENVSPQTLLSGSFNPLHDGHLMMAQAASQMLERPVAFELSAFNVDKPPIPPAIIQGRIAQFAGRHPIYVSNAPTYQGKSRLYPGATFVIGYDTAIRLFNPIYYNNSQKEMEAGIDEISSNNCSFWVAGRVDPQGDFRSLRDIEIASKYEHLFEEIPESLFRLDISSSQLRQSGSAGSR